MTPSASVAMLETFALLKTDALQGPGFEERLSAALGGSAEASVGRRRLEVAGDDGFTPTPMRRCCKCDCEVCTYLASCGLPPPRVAATVHREGADGGGMNHPPPIPDQPARWNAARPSLKTVCDNRTFTSISGRSTHSPDFASHIHEIKTAPR
jgi:hypothetical protein